MNLSPTDPHYVSIEVLGSVLEPENLTNSEQDKVITDHNSETEARADEEIRASMVGPEEVAAGQDRANTSDLSDSFSCSLSDEPARDHVDEASSGYGQATM